MYFFENIHHYLTWHYKLR